MSTPLLDRIAARKCAVCGVPRDPFGRHLDGIPSPYMYHAWTAIPQSPFTRRALSGELPGKVVR